MDGGGSIQVNHWRKQSLQFRLVIKLSNIKSNYDMLVRIAIVIGGTVRITSKGTNVIWVVDNKQEIQEIIKIYDSYPPLTSNKICQLAFLKTCLTHANTLDKGKNLKRDIETFLINRNLKYNKQLDIIYSKASNKTPSYFKEWLSGFIEAEGCFSIKNHYFSIGQKNDYYLINAIKEYFEVTNKVMNPYGKFYFLEVYKKEVLLKIIIHCTNYPLLGEKSESLKKFKKKLF